MPDISVDTPPHLLELLLLARRDVDLGPVLHVRGGNHRANAGPTTGDHGYRCSLLNVVCAFLNVCAYAPIFPFTSNRFGMVKSWRDFGETLDSWYE
jgi:hypothetical protein